MKAKETESTKLLVKLHSDPVMFVETILGVTPQEWQAKALRAVASHDRVSIASGVGTSGIAGSSGSRSKSVTTISEESSGILSLRSRSSIISSQNKKEELMRSQIKKSADDRTTLSDLTKQSRKQFKESCYHMNKIIQQVLRTFLERTITIST